MPQQDTRVTTEIYDTRLARWSKRQLYEAYMSEHKRSSQLQEMLASTNKAFAAARFNTDLWKDAWFRLHVKHHVPMDNSRDIETFLKDPDARVAFTPNGGYYAYLVKTDHLFIFAAWGNPEHYRSEMTEMRELLRGMYETGRPVRFTGNNQHLRNHSKEIEPGLFEITSV
jgi:hypothetical protein